MIAAHPGIGAEELGSAGKIASAEERGKSAGVVSPKDGRPGSLWQPWREDLPHGESLQQAVMEKLRTWASFLDPDRCALAAWSAFALELYDGLSHCGILATFGRKTDRFWRPLRYCTKLAEAREKDDSREDIKNAATDELRS